MKGSEKVMPYVVKPQRPRFYQISFNDILMGKNVNLKTYPFDRTDTKTFYTDNIENLATTEQTNSLIKSLQCFVEYAGNLYDKPRQELYDTFFIPKKSGGLRRIDAPKPELMEALRCLKVIFNSANNYLYHTSAYAYIAERNTLKALKKHQSNESNWFLKVDFSNFFGSTSLEFVQKMLSEISPFSEAMKRKDGKEVMLKALDLCFLGGGLPQGTPMSPMLTNIVMIPIDHLLSKRLSQIEHNFIYTRYADDILISSKTDFDKEEIMTIIKDVLDEFEAPYVFKDEKTRYGSRSGRNWNLGLMLNKDNQITVGSKNKKRFRAMVSNYILDRRNGKSWDLESIQHLRGVMSYYKSIEPNYINSIVQYNNDKYNVDLLKMMESDLRL